MKHYIQRIAALMVLIIAGNTVFAQKPQTNCDDPAVKSIAEGLKKTYVQKGMMLYQEAMIGMTSMEPAPVAVKLLKGQTYQLIYVGSEHSNKLIMEIYDGKDKKIDEKRERGEEYIIYSFTPDKTDVYLITLYQKKGVKNMCGYFGIMLANKHNTAPKYDTVIRPVYRTKEVVTQPKPAAAPVKTTAPPPAQPAVQTTQTAPKETNTKKSPYPELPPNQIPNRNRTRATNEAREGK